MAQKYPEIISAAFLIHSIPLNGFKFFNESGKVASPGEVAEMFATVWPNDMDRDALFEQMRTYSSNPAGLPPTSHNISSYLADSVVMKGKKECMMANV